MNDPRPAILVTGISGTLGLRLLPFLSGFRVIGVDLSPISEHPEIELHQLDLGQESSCVKLVQLLRKCEAQAVVHLAFMDSPSCAQNPERSWQVNVAGTARVMEAISEVNRHGGNISKFVYLSSAALYGADAKPMVDETAPLAAHSLTSAIQKSEADAVVRFRADTMGSCSTYLLRSHLFAGPSVESHSINALRGHACGDSRTAQRLRHKQKRLPLLLPTGKEYLQKLFQFVHIDDVARLIAWMLRQIPPSDCEVVTLNVAGSDSPITLAKCAEIAGARIRRLPSVWLCGKMLRLRWNRGISAVPPDSLPYINGCGTTSTRRLREFLGSSYAQVIQFSTESALRDSFRET